MAQLLLNLLLVLLPALWYTIRVDRRDRRIRSGTRFVWRVLLGGGLSVAPALAVLWFAGPFLARLPDLLGVLVTAFLLAGIIEELCKLGVVRVLVMGRPEFDEWADGIRYTVVASMGFAFLENSFYLTEEVTVAALRAIFAVAAHTVASGILGYYVGKTQFVTDGAGRHGAGRNGAGRNAGGRHGAGRGRDPRREHAPRPETARDDGRAYPGSILTGLLLAAFVHGGYDALIRVNGLLTFLLVPWLIGWALFLGRLYHHAHVADSRARRPRLSPLA